MDDSDAIVSALERRAGLIRAEIRRIDVLVEELRHVDSMLAFYKARATVPTRPLSLLMPAQITYRESETARRNREILAAVRRVLLTQPEYAARVGLVFESLPEEIRDLIGGKDPRVGAEILRHRIRESGDELGVRYERGIVSLATTAIVDNSADPTHVSEAQSYEELQARSWDGLLARRLDELVAVSLDDGMNRYGRLSRAECGHWRITTPTGSVTHFTSNEVRGVALSDDSMPPEVMRAIKANQTKPQSGH